MANILVNIRKALSRACVDLGGAQTCILLAASGRSGTTWIGDYLSHVFGFRFVFEPFWKLHMRADGQDDFFHHRFIADDDGRYDEYIRTVLRGRYSARISNENYKIGWCHGRVIKDICANLFIPRIHAVAPGVPVIYLVRHPCAVALSRRRKGEFAGEWGRHGHLFLQQPALVGAIGDPLRHYAGRELTDHEDYALSTCVENFFLHRLAKTEPYIHRVFYEELVLDFEDAMRRIVEFVQRHAGYAVRKPMDRIRNYYLLSHPDTTRALKQDPRKQLLAWRDKLTPEEVAAVYEMNDRFMLDYHRDIEALIAR